METKQIVTPGNLDTTLKMGKNEEGKYGVNHDNTLTTNAQGQLSVTNPAGASGLDCASIAALPVKSFDKGTTVLAQKDGECFRLAPKEALFQEIGVGMAASKTVGDVGDTYHVITTVTNSGEGTNEVTELVITKPALGSYTLSNFTNHASTGATIEKVDDLHYNIRGLKSGGTAKVEFDVVANASGTFQFGASVNANTALDMQSNNNTATVTLSARIVVNPDIVPSADCPIIEATIDGHKLVSHSQPNDQIYFVTHNSAAKNLLLTHETLSGLTVSFKQDILVIVQVYFSTQPMMDNLKLSNGKYLMNKASWVNSFVKESDSAASSFTDYTFENGVLTLGNISDGYKCCRISVRPKGNNCKWQHFDIMSGSVAYTPVRNIELNTTLNHTKSMTTNRVEVTDKPNDLAFMRSIVNIIGDASIVGWYYGGNNSSLTTENDKLVITLPAGQVTTGTITATEGYLEGLNTQGNIKCVYDPATKQVTVTTLDTVSAADNFVYKNITFKVE